jgi:LysR family hydrogen peroxide-inducible transcriptional activator
MKNLTLKQLRYFEALAREGHFGRAADVCAISQPALSLQIKDMEDSLGALLFERSARQVRLTGFGEAFGQRVRTILQAVDELEELARAASQEPLARLRMGVIPTVAPYLLPRIIADLAQSLPGLQLHLRETITPKLVQELTEGRLDMAIVALPASEPAFQEFPLMQEEFVLVRPPADEGKPAPDLDALKTMRLLLLEEGHCFREQALAFCDLNASRPREMLEGSTLGTLVQMVGAGIGVTLIPAMAVPVETRSAHVSIVRFPDRPPQRRLGMIWRKASPLSAHFEHLAKTIRHTIERHQNETPFVAS